MSRVADNAASPSFMFSCCSGQLSYCSAVVASWEPACSSISEALLQWLIRVQCAGEDIVQVSVLLFSCQRKGARVPSCSPHLGAPCR